MDKDGDDYTIVMSLREIKVDDVSSHINSSKGEKAANIDFVVNSGRKCYITKYM